MKKISPKSDKRDRVTQSVTLYVACSNIHNPNGDSPYIDIVDSCERAVFGVKGCEGDYVRYKNNAYKLYSAKSFKRILRRAKNGEVKLKHHNGVSSDFPVSLERLAPAHYCVLEKSPGHFHRFRFA